MKPELPPAVLAPPQGAAVWWVAVRPRTLSISVTPVIVGVALAHADGAPLAWLPALVTLLCALLIQAATNLHNDAADFESGVDGPGRIGPLRVTAAGWVSAARVRRAAAWCFALALLQGVYLVQRGGWPILLAGLASLAAARAYSGGPWPISRGPLGEVFVLVFFGLVAVAGSYYLQAGLFGPMSLLAGLAVGAPAAAVLLVNNFRDLETDAAKGRHTLAAVLGAQRFRAAYGLAMLAPFALLLPLVVFGHPGAALALAALPVSWRLLPAHARCPEGPPANQLLAATARSGLAFGGLLAAGLLIFH